MDSDDLRQSWFLGRIFHRLGAQPTPEDMENGEAQDGNAGSGSQRASNWGSRGISVSADEGVLANERERQRNADGGSKVGVGGQTPEYTAADAKMKDPDELARILDGDEDSDDEEPAVGHEEVGNGREWRDGA